MILAVISLFLGKTVIGWRHIGFPILFTTLYVSTVVIAFCFFNTSWPYGFLSILGTSPSTLKPLPLVLIYVASIVAVVIFYWITLLLIALRDRGKDVDIRDEVTPDNSDNDSIELTRIRVRSNYSEDLEANSR